MMRTYTAVIERDLDSGWLVASVVELPGCFTQAPDEQSLEENIREAIRTYLAGEDVEDDVPLEYLTTKRITVPVDVPLSASP